MRPISLYLTPTLLNETKVANLNKLQNTHVNAVSFHMAHFKLQNTHVNAVCEITLIVDERVFDISKS